MVGSCPAYHLDTGVEMETEHFNNQPNLIRHPFHPLHALIPNNGKIFLFCNACRKSDLDFAFRCDGCDFDLDAECALLVPSIKYEGHEHLLTLFDKIDDNHCLCNSCNTPCSTLVLRCVNCNFNIHKSCAHKPFVELPKQIQHPFHPLHPLTLTSHPHKQLTCSACLNSNPNFSYHCDECDFTLGNECRLLAATIKYEGHHHLLTLLEELDFYIWCGSCGGICHGYVFRCVECNFNLHPLCLPSFPRTILHKCHIDPLTLTNHVDEDVDLEEFYCDACEKERDRRDSVYYCADCFFVAHIKCVLTEVLPLFNAEQEKIVWPKEAEIRHASTVEDLVGVSVGDDVTEKGDSVAMPSEKIGAEITAGQEEVGVEVAADPVLAKLEGEIARIQKEVEALTAKLEALESEHAQYVASKMLSARDKCLSEASTSE